MSTIVAIEEVERKSPSRLMNAAEREFQEAGDKEVGDKEEGET
jgi:hypothetical protein